MWYIVDKPVCNVMLWTGFFMRNQKYLTKTCQKR